MPNFVFRAKFRLGQISSSNFVFEFRLRPPPPPGKGDPVSRVNAIINSTRIWYCILNFQCASHGCHDRRHRHCAKLSGFPGKTIRLTCSKDARKWGSEVLFGILHFLRHIQEKLCRRVVSWYPSSKFQNERKNDLLMWRRSSCYQNVGDKAGIQ